MSVCAWNVVLGEDGSPTRRVGTKLEMLRAHFGVVCFAQCSAASTEISVRVTLWRVAVAGESKNTQTRVSYFSCVCVV